MVEEMAHEREVTGSNAADPKCAKILKKCYTHRVGCVAAGGVLGLKKIAIFLPFFVISRN